ncbi:MULTISPECIES: hypothetical protein [unclassified Streptomyces]|uniref:hypothetical protein n=1 Tax=unclassified Streptomyces TaxID=2593676 RepID=UPI003821138E
MSVPASQSPAPASRRRRAAIVAGAVLLALATAACSELDRTAIGTISYSTGTEQPVMLTSPKVRGCHRLPPTGATYLNNNTLVDMVMYPTPNCTGKATTYIGSRFANNVAPKAPPWRSYTFVH